MWHYITEIKSPEYMQYKKVKYHNIKLNFSYVSLCVIKSNMSEVTHDHYTPSCSFQNCHTSLDPSLSGTVYVRPTKLMRLQMVHSTLYLLRAFL